MQSPSVQKKKRKSRNSFEGSTEVYKRAKQREPVSRSATPSSESTESNETSSGRQTTETTSTTPELFDTESAATVAAVDISSLEAAAAKGEPDLDHNKQVLSSRGAKLEAFGDQFPPLDNPAMVQPFPVALTGGCSSSDATRSEMPAGLVPIKSEPVDPMELASQVKDEKLVFKTEPNAVVPAESVIVGRSGLTPPPSPIPVSCSDEVQISQPRQVVKESPNQRYGNGQLKSFSDIKHSLEL